MFVPLGTCWCCVLLILNEVSLTHSLISFIQRLFASHTDGFFGHRVVDPLADEEERRNINIWSDMEKCIFFDRFMQHPKDFRRIASFLTRKSTKDCIAFYYNSKKTVPYKHALKEFLQRKKCRGDVVPWDATIQACLSMGAVIKAGSSPERPLKFILPESDFTYSTRLFHPMRLEVFKDLNEMVSNSKQRDDGKAHLRNRKRSNWFILDMHEKKYLKHGDINDDHHSFKRKLSATKAPATDANSDDGDSSHIVIKSKPTRVKTNKLEKSNSDVQGDREGGEKHQNDEQQSHKPQKWKAKEKELFFHALNKFGKLPTTCALNVASQFISNPIVTDFQRPRLVRCCWSRRNAYSYTSQELLL